MKGYDHERGRGSYGFGVGERRRILTTLASSWMKVARIEVQQLM